MELRQIFSLAWKWLWLIILSVVIAAGSSYYASRQATPLYRTKTTLMVGQITRNPEASSSDLYTSQQLAYTYSQLALREPVLSGVIKSLDLQMSWGTLAGMVSASMVPQTQLLEIYVVDSNPYRAKVLADAIAEQLILQSPAGSSINSQEDLNFIREQMSELKTKIETGQDNLKRLNDELDASNSALQIKDLQDQINVLENKISDWQDSYSNLLVSLQGGNVNVLNVVEEATVPYDPISPNTRMNVLVASAIGLVLAVGGVVLMEYLDVTIKDSDDVERATGLPTIGSIEKITGKNYSDKLIANQDPLNPVVEDFRSLRNNIRYSLHDRRHQLLLVTSTNPGEGKSICSANLAVVIAHSGQNVILVDSDFRRPTQNLIFNVSNDTGLSTLIEEGGVDIEGYLKDVGVKNLRVLPTGPLPLDPNSLLESERLRDILPVFKTLADVVLFDTPPMMVVADAVTLGTQVDGVILVVEYGSTHIDHVRRLVKEMRRINIPFIGAVLNRVIRKKGNYYNYYYYNHNGHTNGRSSRKSSFPIPELFNRRKNFSLAEPFQSERIRRNGSGEMIQTELLPTVKADGNGNLGQDRQERSGEHHNVTDEIISDRTLLQ